MASEIVHDDNISLLEGRNQLLFDIGAKAFAVDRTIENAWGCELVAAERTEECQRPPMAVWCKASQAATFGSPTAERRHVGLDPGLIDKDQTRWIETGLQ